MKPLIRYLDFLIVCCLLTVVSSADNNVAEESPTVETEQGTLKGIVQQSRNARNYYGFLGVRYAAKTERFEVARAAVSWEGTRDANQFGPECPQFYFPSTDVIGDEDCLVINLYTAKLEKEAKMPVLVFFHGGAFIFGSGAGYGAKYFMDQDVVLVTVNYRLGVLGFLSTENEAIQGNLGLKDQTAALKWVQENIANFGGDKEKVVIFGESAGAASVNFHLLSPMSRGLFAGAISQSGSVLNPWAFQRKPLENAKKLGDLLNCTLKTGIKSSQKFKDCLKTKTMKEIVDSQRNFVKLISGDPICPFAPTVEKVSDETAKTSPVFLSDSPYKLLSDEKLRDKLNLNVPWIVGVTEDEGILLHAGVILNRDNSRGRRIMNSLVEDRGSVYPITLMFDDTVDMANWRSISDRIHEFYFGLNEIGQDTSQDLINMYSDRWFNHGVYKAAKLFAKQGATVYRYVMTFKGNYSFSTFYGARENFPGVTHLDDLPYLFNMTFCSEIPPEISLDSDERIIRFSKNFVELWTTFGKSGKPEISSEPTEWKPMEKEGQDSDWYIVDAKPKVSNAPFAERMKFWDELPLLNEMEREIFPRDKTKSEL